MNPQKRIKANWLTRNPNDLAYLSTFFLAITVILFSYFYLNEIIGASNWMGATGELVFKNRDYWRLWSTLFAHADIEHLLSNLVLLVPLAFLLTGYFGLFVFPLAGFFFGGLINYVVLRSMPQTTGVIGISGLVYWMGAVWLTLSVLVDRRHSLRRRIAVAVFLSVVLFIPETYHPEVSYLSHFVGYILGAGFAVVYYFFNRQRFEAAEIVEWIVENPELSYLDKQALGLIDDPKVSSPDDVPLPKSVI